MAQCGAIENSCSDLVKDRALSKDKMEDFSYCREVPVFPVWQLPVHQLDHDLKALKSQEKAVKRQWKVKGKAVKRQWKVKGKAVKRQWKVKKRR